MWNLAAFRTRPCADSRAIEFRKYARVRRQNPVSQRINDLQESINLARDFNRARRSVSLTYRFTFGSLSQMVENTSERLLTTQTGLEECLAAVRYRLARPVDEVARTVVQRHSQG